MFFFLESAIRFDDGSLEREAEATTRAVNVVRLLNGNGRNVQRLSDGLGALGNGLGLLGRHGDELTGFNVKLVEGANGGGRANGSRLNSGDSGDLLGDNRGSGLGKALPQQTYMATMAQHVPHQQLARSISLQH